MLADVGETERMARLSALIDALPQASVVDAATRHAWLGQTLRVDPGRVEWHIARAGGFGGSEAGLLLEWATRHDERPVVGTGWGSVERLVRQKLLLLAPDAPGIDALRGIALEPMIASLFEEFLTRSGRVWSRRDDVRRLVEDGPHPGMPWLRASLDGVYEIDGGLWIVDFKAPSETSLEKHREEVSTGYVAQLNHYALVAAGKGVPVRGLALAMLDYRRFGDNPIAFFEVPGSDFMRRRIAEGARVLWHEHVLAGRVPEAASSVSREPPPGVVEALRELRDIRAGLAELTRRKEALSERVAGLMRAAGIERLAVDLGDGKANVSLRAALDAERAWERLAAFAEGDAGRERLRKDVYQREFRDQEAAVSWFDRLSEVLAGTPVERLPSGLREVLMAPPEIATGRLLPQPARAALRAVGERPEDFERPVLQARF